MAWPCCLPPFSLSYGSFLLNPPHLPQPRKGYTVALKPAAFSSGRESPVLSFRELAPFRPELDPGCFISAEGCPSLSLLWLFPGTSFVFPRVTGLQLTLPWGALVFLHPVFLAISCDPSKWEALTPKIQGVPSVFHDPQTEGLLSDLTL